MTWRWSSLAGWHLEGGNGEYAKALEWQQKAIDLTKSDEMKLRYLARVELFKQGKPFRLDPKTATQVPAPSVVKASN